MPRKRSPIRIVSEYVALRSFMSVLGAMGPRSNMAMAPYVAKAIHALDRKHRERAKDSLRIAFPDASEQRIDHLSRCAIEHYVRLLFELQHLPRLIHEESWAHRLRLGNLGPVLSYLNAGRGVVMVTGHLGNWEVLGYLLAVLGYRIDAVARPIDNPLLNNWIMGIRERKGLRIVTKWDATDRMVEVLGGAPQSDTNDSVLNTGATSGGSGGALGFIGDQSAGDRGLFVPFFGRMASAYKSIGLLAIRMNVPVVCGCAVRMSEGYEYRVDVDDVIEPADWQGLADPLFYVTARYMRSIERMVRKHPEQYVWMHRRWRSRPTWERHGKPMPVRVRQNLESLPWMDDATLVRLQEPME
ncbi:MAG: hypothetical protein GC164_13320 [Phycisphaera sp.]|nr:hypothetical protein [Phycisphaera sp.]